MPNDHRTEREPTTAELQRQLAAARAEIAALQQSVATERELRLELVRAEQSVRESESRFRVLADGAPVVLFVDGPDGGVQFVNRTYCDYFGITPEEVEGGKWQPLVHPDDSSDYVERFMTAVREQVPFNCELRVRRADGQWRSAETIAEPRMSPSGEYLGHAGIIVDLTDRKQAEAERARLQSELLHAQKLESVGRLAGGVAHDFNNMLAVILGGVELALRQVHTAPLRAGLIEVRTAAQRSAGLTRQLLAFARKQPIEPKPLDLSERMGAMIDMVGRLIGENIELDWQPTPSLWRVKMDSVQFDQVVTNLCVNARDSIANVGTIRIEANNCSFDQEHCASHSSYLPGDFVRLVVSDNGCGMNEQELEHLFEPFFTTKSLGNGTGLGLATVYGIVQQNKGFIEVTSAPDTGTTFEIFLPRLLHEHQEAAPEGKVRPLRSAHETILLVEDEPTLARTYTRMLEELGYHVVTATSASDAIFVAEEHGAAIDLLVTDVIMPKMNGRELASTLSSRWPRLKHLFMSGYTADIIADHGVLDSDVMFIEKPFSSHELAEKVDAALHDQRDVAD